eukprot:1157908-Pyramimonas_sp.AAC.1
MQSPPPRCYHNMLTGEELTRSAKRMGHEAFTPSRQLGPEVPRSYTDNRDPITSGEEIYTRGVNQSRQLRPEA